MTKEESNATKRRGWPAWAPFLKKAGWELYAVALTAFFSGFLGWLRSIPTGDWLNMPVGHWAVVLAVLLTNMAWASALWAVRRRKRKKAASPPPEARRLLAYAEQDYEGVAWRFRWTYDQKRWHMADPVACCPRDKTPVIDGKCPSCNKVFRLTEISKKRAKAFIFRQAERILAGEPAGPAAQTAREKEPSRCRRAEQSRKNENV